MPEVLVWLARLWLVAGVAGIALSLAAGVVAWIFIGSTADTAGRTLDITAEILDTAAQTAVIVDATVDDVARSLRTTQQSVADAAVTLTQVSRLTSNLGDLIGQDIPDGLDAVKASLPPIAATAGVADTALRALAFFGGGYDPEVPLDEAIADLEASLEDIPRELRAQAPLIEASAESLGSLGGDTLVIAGDLSAIRARMLATSRVLSDYRATVAEAQTVVAGLGPRLESQAALARWVALVLSVALAGGQTLPAAVGWWALSRRPA